MPLIQPSTEEDRIGTPPPEPSRADDPQFWRDRAEQARIMASEMRDATAIESLFLAAKGYDRLAEIAETRLRNAEP
jgi:hypothetical protein